MGEFFLNNCKAIWPIASRENQVQSQPQQVLRITALNDNDMQKNVVVSIQIKARWRKYEWIITEL